MTIKIQIPVTAEHRIGEAAPHCIFTTRVLSALCLAKPTAENTPSVG